MHLLVTHREHWDRDSNPATAPPPLGVWDISEVKETQGPVQAASWPVAVGLCGAAGWEGPCAAADFAIHPSLRAVPIGSYPIFGCMRS